MNISIRDPSGAELVLADLPAIPQEGNLIYFNAKKFSVESVTWTIDDSGFKRLAVYVDEVT